MRSRIFQSSRQQQTLRKVRNTCAITDAFTQLNKTLQKKVLNLAQCLVDDFLEIKTIQDDIKFWCYQHFQCKWRQKIFSDQKFNLKGKRINITSSARLFHKERADLKKINPCLLFCATIVNFVCVLCCVVLLIRQNVGLTYLPFILGPKSGSRLFNTYLFSWVFSVKFFVECVRPHSKASFQTMCFEVFWFCLFPYRMLPMSWNFIYSLYYTYYYLPFDLLIDCGFAIWISTLPFIDHSRFLTILMIANLVKCWGPCQCVTPILSNAAFTTKCILQWLRLLLLQFDSFLVSNVWILWRYADSLTTGL